jgi:hypothetical protein
MFLDMSISKGIYLSLRSNISSQSNISLVYKMDTVDHKVLNHHDKQYLSLGYVCTVPSLLMGLNKRGDTCIFDRIGTPMWAVKELVENGFIGFFKQENLCYDDVFKGKKFLVDTAYNIRHAGNERIINNPKTYEEVKDRMKGFIDNFMRKLNEDKEIVFIRMEEPSSYPDLGERIIQDEHVEKYSLAERYYVEQFAEMIKKKYPNLKFTILFMNSEGYFA